MILRNIGIHKLVNSMGSKPAKVNSMITSDADNTVYNLNVQTESGYNITRLVYDGKFSDTAFIRFTDDEGNTRRTSVDCDYDSEGFHSEKHDLVHTPVINGRSYRGSNMHKEVVDAVAGRKLLPAETEKIANPLRLTLQ